MKFTQFLAILLFSSLVFAEDFKKAYKEAGSDDEKLKIISRIVEEKDKSASKVLVDALKEGESSGLRSHAALGLGTLGTGVDELQIAYDKDDTRVRESCMAALADIGATKSTSYFEKGLKDKNETIQLEALRGLSKVANSSHAKFFREKLKSNNENTVLYSLTGIGKAQVKEEWRSIKEFCIHSNPNFVIACLDASGKIKNEDALPTIESQLSSKDPNISKSAILAIGNFSGFKTISVLIRFKQANPSHPNMEEAGNMLKKLKAAKQYAIVQDALNLRSESNDRANVVAVLKPNIVVEILKKDPRKYTVQTSKGELENFWYNVKTEDGKKGFLFGEYLQVVDSY